MGNGLPNLVWIIGLLGLSGIGVPFAARHRDRRAPINTIVLVGGSSPVAYLAAILRGHDRQRAVGAVPKPSLHRVATLAEARTLVATIPCDLIVLAVSEQSDEPILDGRGHRVQVVAGVTIIERFLQRLPLDIAVGDPWLNNSAATVARHRYWKGKRLGDLLVVVFAGIILLPLGLLVGLTVWLESRGPVIVSDSRVGLNGRPFALYSFRTSGLLLPHTTRVGWLIRRAHLDLIPALWNVLRGDLSLVGPRPERIEETESRSREHPLYRLRTRVCPGLASWAQVRFRYSDSPRDTRLALEYDLYYVKHASPWLDLRIFGRAVWLLLCDLLRLVGMMLRVIARRTTRAVANAMGRRTMNLSIAFPECGPEESDYRATLIVGAGEAGQLLVSQLRGNPQWGFWPVAFVDDDFDKIGKRFHGVPVLGDTEVISAVVRREHVDTVVLAIPSASEVTLQRIAEVARQSSAQILTMPHIGTLLRSNQRTITLETFQVTDILGRPVIEPDVDRCRAFVTGRRVLVTGAAGSIGRELVRQVARLEPALLIGLDINESDLFDLQQELGTEGAFRPLVASVTNRHRIEAIFAQYQPEIVFHAAAYKHVPMMEEYPQEAVMVNTIGTYDLAHVAAAAGVARFVLVSTDKAVRPSSVMGASKRLAELAVRAVATERGMSACAVRFGNVLGSRGSVVPLFEKQIAAGGPVKITDPRMNRYFMTIAEAAGLIVQAGAFGDTGVVYMLDMGDEVSIRDLAERMIRLRGLRVGMDIEIIYTGLRPGEKLHEELAHDFEATRPTAHPKIHILEAAAVSSGREVSMGRVMAQLAESACRGEAREIRRTLMDLIAKLDEGAFEEPSFTDRMGVINVDQQ